MNAKAMCMKVNNVYESSNIININNVCEYLKIFTNVNKKQNLLTNVNQTCIYKKCQSFMIVNKKISICLRQKYMFYEFCQNVYEHKTFCPGDAVSHSTGRSV